MPGAQSGPVPILRLFGVTMEGNSVCANVHGFLPYFFVPAPSEGFRDEHCRRFREELNRAILNDLRSNRENLQEAVLAVDLCQKCSIYGFYFNQKSRFLKVTLALPKLVAPARRLVSQIIVPPFGQIMYQVFEANIEFEVRFMVDTGVVGCNWIELPAGKYYPRSPTMAGQGGVGICPTSGFTMIGGGGASVNRLHPHTKCQLEVDVSFEDFISHPAEGEWQKIAPLRILSFDIECKGRKGVFPEAEVDPVIQIANMVILQGDGEPLIRNVFTLNSCAPMVGSDVIEFKGQEERSSPNVSESSRRPCESVAMYPLNCTHTSTAYVHVQSTCMYVSLFPPPPPPPPPLSLLRVHDQSKEFWEREEKRMLQVSPRK